MLFRLLGVYLLLAQFALGFAWQVGSKVGHACVAWVCRSWLTRFKSTIAGVGKGLELPSAQMNALRNAPNVSACISETNNADLSVALHNPLAGSGWSSTANRMLSVMKRGTTANSTVNIANAKGEDVWDGEITNEDMGDRFGPLAFTLGVLAIVLMFLIILTLSTIYHTEKTQAKAYRKLYKSA